jgi:hypothetical protein
MDKDVISLIGKLSSNPTIKSSVLQRLIFSNDVAIHSRQLEIAIQEYESTTNYKELNLATSVEEYSNLKELHSLPAYSNFLKDLDYFCGEKIEEKDIIIIPMNIVFIDNYHNKIKFTGNHSAIVLVHLSKKKIYIIDSDNEETSKEKPSFPYTEAKYDYYLKRKVKDMVECLFKDTFTIKIVDTKAPQFLTKDIYCIFWSFLITEMIVNQYNKTKKISPSIVLKNIMKEYNTKKKLNSLIRDYIKKFL